MAVFTVSLALRFIITEIKVWNERHLHALSQINSHVPIRDLVEENWTKLSIFQSDATKNKQTKKPTQNLTFVLVLFIKIIIYCAEEQSKTKGPLCSSLDEPRALLVRSRMKHQHKKMQNKAAGATTTLIYPL